VRKRDSLSTEKGSLFHIKEKDEERFPIVFPGKRFSFLGKKKLSPGEGIRGESPSLLGKKASAGLYLWKA